MTTDAHGRPTGRDLPDPVGLGPFLDRMLDGCAVFEAVYADGTIVDFERIYLNPAGVRLRLAAGADLRVTRLTEASPGVLTDGLFQRYVEVVERGEPWYGGSVAHRDHGHLGSYELHAWPVQGGFAVTWREISERQRLVDQAMLSEQRFRATVDQLPDAVSVFESVRGEDGRIEDFRWVYCNSYNAEMTGYAVEDLVGKRLLEIFPEQEPAGMIQVYTDVVESGTSWQQPTVWYEDTWGDGTRRRRAFDVRASKVGDGFVVVSRDVTDLRLTTESLQLREHELTEAQRLAHVGSWTYQPTTGEWNWSAELRDILGFGASDEIDMMSLTGAIHPEDTERVNAALAANLRDGGEFDLGYRIMGPQGSVRHVHARGVVEVDEDGRPQLARGTLLDQTEILRVSAELAESNERLEKSNTTLSDLIGIIGHDLRNPLTASLGFMNLADEHLAASEPQRAHQLVRRAIVAGQRVQGLLDSILDMARIDFGGLQCDLAELDAATVIEQAVADVAPERPVDIVVPGGVMLQGDASQLRQIIGNLVSNAFKYGAPPVIISAAQRDNYVEIAVTDHGPGVPEHFVPRLFDRFSRAHSTTQIGTGLGLYLARQLSRAAQGDLDYLPATPGQRHQFVVRLLAADQGALSPPP